MAVGRLLSVDDMGNWPRKGVMPCRKRKKVGYTPPLSSNSAGARLHEQRAGVKYADGKGKEVAGAPRRCVLSVL